jgi:hypothetical protein
VDLIRRDYVDKDTSMTYKEIDLACGAKHRKVSITH